MTSFGFVQSGSMRHCLSFGLTLCLAAAAFAASPASIADVQINSRRVAWVTRIGAQGWTLSVSGEGIYLRERYEPADRIALDVVAPDGERLPDGTYNWELRALSPEVERSLATRQSSAQQRQAVRTKNERGDFERRSVGRPIVASGSFRIVGGSFVIPVAEEEPKSTTAGQ